MSSGNSNRYNFYEHESYGTRLLKGLTRDQVLNQITKHPLLLKYYKKNDSQTQNRIIDTLMRQPSQADCPGFIYGFKDFSIHKLNPYAHQYEIKLGRTKKEMPQNRIYEWERQDGHQYVELFTIRSEHNNKLESLVHLFFAYARRIKYINGKKRIQWFTFQEKTLNAAATAMINDLMEKVHQLAKNNQTQPSSLSYDLPLFSQQLNRKISGVEFLKKKLVMVGLKQSGKSIIKAMLNGLQLQAVPSTNSQLRIFETSNSLQILAPQLLDNVQNIIEITRNHEVKGQMSKEEGLQRMKESFWIWSSINSVEETAIPCLIVAQTDLLSSQMIGLRTALTNFMEFIKISSSENTSETSNSQNQIPAISNDKSVLDLVSSFKLLLVITKVDRGHIYSQEKVKKYLNSRKQYFSQQEMIILSNSSIFFNYLPEKQGKHDYNVESIIQAIQGHDFSTSQSLSFEYTDRRIAKICQETIHYAYEEVALKFEDYFKSALKKLTKNYEAQNLLNHLSLNQSDKQGQMNEKSEYEQGISSLSLIESKLQFINKLQRFIKGIKSTRRQQDVLVNLKWIHIELQFQETDRTLSQFITFCECMLKSSTPLLIDSEQEQKRGSQDYDQQKFLSPAYLSNSLIFSRLSEKISLTREQMREQINSTIENQMKQTFVKVVSKFYSSLDETTPAGKVIFNQVYNVLLKLMNMHEAIQLIRVERRLHMDKVGDEVIEEQILIKSIDDLMELSGGNSSIYRSQFTSLIKIITQIYRISRQQKIRTNSILSRIKEAIYVGTKGKKQIAMMGLKQVDTKYTQGNINTYRRSPNNSILMVNGDVKMIMNKKNQAKNQRLLNYINEKKSNQQNQSLEIRQNTSIEITHNNSIEIRQNNSLQISAQSNRIHTRSFQIIKETKKQVVKQNKPFLQQMELIELPDSDSDFDASKIEQTTQLFENTLHLSSQDEFFSMSENGSSQEEKKQPETKQQEMKELDFQPITKKQNKQQSQTVNNEQSYNQFFYQLLNMSQFKNKHQLSSLKDLYTNALFKLEIDKKYQHIVFNHTKNLFLIDLPSITLHNSFVIIFANRIMIDPQYESSEINFKIHYKSRRPNKIHLILIAEGFEGVNKLKIEENKYGKVLMVEVTKVSERKYKVLDGYFTKNKRNYSKLQELKVKELVEAYCKNTQ